MREGAGAVPFAGPTATSTISRTTSQVGKGSPRRETPSEGRDRTVSMLLKKETKVLERLLVTSSGQREGLRAMAAATETVVVSALAGGRVV